MSQRASNGDKKQNVMFVTQNFRSEALIEVFLGKPTSYLSLRRRWREYVVQAAPLARPLPLGLIVPNLCSRGPLTVDRFAPMLPRPDRIVREEGMELLPPRFDLPIEAALAALLVNVGRARVLPPSPGPGSKPSAERGRGGKRSNGERGERSDLCGVLNSLSLGQRLTWARAGRISGRPRSSFRCQSASAAAAAFAGRSPSPGLRA